MKQLQWSKYQGNELNSTIWASVKNEDLIRKELNLSEFENEFAVSTSANATKNVTAGTDNKIDDKKSSVISLIDSKRSYHICNNIKYIFRKSAKFSDNVIKN